MLGGTSSRASASSFSAHTASPSAGGPAVSGDTPRIEDKDRDSEPPLPTSVPSASQLGGAALEKSGIKYAN